MPADIDLIIVYEPPLTPDSAPCLRRLAEAVVTAHATVPPHVLLFTRREAAETPLLLGPTTVVYERGATRPTGPAPHC